jgi:exodeoxyribonuclease VII large subunit
MTNFWDYQEKMRRPAAGKAAPASPPGAAAQAQTVSQLTAQIDRALKAGLPASVSVKGEVSNLNHHRASGHCYFTLKDAGACIDCVMFRGDYEQVKFRPEDGMELLAAGRVAVFAQRGRYQLYVTRLDPLGQGALELAKKQLQAKLEAEGLFDIERKRLIPAYPSRIALVTSTQTAAIQDMLKVLWRFSWLRLYVYHVPVQGDGSAEKMAAALADLGRAAHTIGGIDVILLGRGGGSLEDLWEFNEEVLVREIVACPIPIVTGIGHEIDVSLADLAADHHAHTPTEAAQVATANWRNARDLIDGHALRLRRELRTVLQHARQRLQQIERHEVFRRPLDRINTARQLLDDRQRGMQLVLSNRLRRVQGQLHHLSGRLEQYRPAAIILRLRDRLAQSQQNLAQAMATRLRIQQDRLSRLVAALSERHPRHAIRLNRQQLDGLSGRLDRAMSGMLQRRSQRLAAMAAHLNAIGPEQVLRRGYSITTLKKGGAVVRSADQLRVGDRIVNRFADGTAESTVEDSRQLRLFE